MSFTQFYASRQKVASEVPANAIVSWTLLSAATREDA